MKFAILFTCENKNRNVFILVVNKKNDFFSIQRLLSIQPIDLKFKQLVDQKCSKSNDARVVYVRPRVVVVKKKDAWRNGTKQE